MIDFIIAGCAEYEIKRIERKNSMLDAKYRAGKTPDELIQAARQKQIAARVKIWRLLNEKAR